MDDAASASKYAMLFRTIRAAQEGIPASSRTRRARCVTYAQALTEIQRGRKRSHWIWYVWPAHQAVRPKTSRPQYSLPSFDAYVCYLGDPILSERLLEITSAAIVHISNRVKLNILFGSSTDAEKFHETMTLFLCAAADQLRRHQLKMSTDVSHKMSCDVFRICARALDLGYRGVLSKRSMKAIASDGVKVFAGMQRVNDVRKIVGAAASDARTAPRPPPASSADVATKSSSASATWEWFDGDTWKPYESKISKILERAYRAGRRSLRIDLSGDGSMYEIVLVGGYPHQRNVRSQYKRDIRRRASCNRTVEWSWFDDDMWIPYDTETSGRLEKARVEGLQQLRMTANVKGHVQTYVVDVAGSNLRQKNLRSGRTRRVRRIDTTEQRRREVANSNATAATLSSTSSKGATASFASNPSSSKPAVEWSWFDDDTWIPYDTETSGRLEKARVEGLKRLRMTANVKGHVQTYVVDVAGSNLRQKNLRSGRTRRVRRIERTGAVTTMQSSSMKESAPPPKKCCAPICKFHPKRSTGPLSSWCRNCELHKDKHLRSGM